MLHLMMGVEVGFYSGLLSSLMAAGGNNVWWRALHLGTTVLC